MTGNPSRPRGRYAPSPTGELHLGNASSALLAWLSIRARGGCFVLRVEDIDRARVRPGLAEGILADLAWLGLDWDEGPDVGGPHAPYAQWERLDRYETAFGRLRDEQRLYPCFCSRKDIAAAASAPQTPGDEIRYPGTCRELADAETGRRVAAGDRHAWRFRVPEDAEIAFEDRVHGSWRDPTGRSAGDFVIRRADGGPSYQLAVVVDDIAMEIDEVVRGDDLLPSTLRQRLLFRALACEPPTFGHVPLLMGTDGARLSKRHAGTSIRELREIGWTPEAIVGRLAHRTGLRAEPSPVPAGDLVGGFDLGQVAAASGGLVVDLSRWSLPRDLRT